MRRLSLIVVALTTTLLMSSCSLIPGLGGAQSGVQACAAISDVIQTSMNEFSKSLSSADADPKDASEALDKLVNDLSGARAKVSNAEVGAALDKSVNAAKKLSEMLKAAGSDATKLDSTKYTAAAQEVQAAMTEFAQSCTKV